MNPRPPATADVIFGYTRREYDAETGLNYHRRRYYDPDTGRWLSEDPIGTADDANLYRYVGNFVTGATDPTGLYAKPFSGALQGVGSSLSSVGGFLDTLSTAPIQLNRAALAYTGDVTIDAAQRFESSYLGDVYSTYNTYGLGSDRTDYLSSWVGRQVGLSCGPGC